MITVTAAEFQRRFGRYREAAHREPVAITSHGRESVVLLSAAEYERLKRQDRAALHVWELDEGDLEAIAATEPPEEAARYDHEVEP
jgi:prevent-host-death family protein